MLCWFLVPLVGKNFLFWWSTGMLTIAVFIFRRFSGLFCGYIWMDYIWIWMDLCSIKLKNCYISAFADDTSTLFNEKSWKTLNDTVNQGLNQVIKPWFEENKLTLNLSKIICIPFSTNYDGVEELKIRFHHCNANQNCNCEYLKLEHQAEYLGIMLDRGLTWSEHVKKIEGQLSKVIYSIIFLKRFLSLDSLRIVFMSFFQSVLNYGIAVYGGASSNILKPILRLERRAIKTILNLPQTYPSAELYDLLNVKGFHELYQRQLKRLTPLFQSEPLPQREIKYEIRNPSQVIVQQPRLEVSKRNVGYTVKSII